jgi:hypothetical protein
VEQSGVKEMAFSPEPLSKSHSSKSFDRKIVMEKEPGSSLLRTEKV